MEQNNETVQTSGQEENTDRFHRLPSEPGSVINGGIMTTQRETVIVDLSADQGTIRPIHGVNNGPMAMGGIVDLAPFHKELRFPSMRLHDSEWPNPTVVDVPAIFPDFGADPENPASYRFEKTDDYLAPIMELGAEFVYGLGPSIEHTKRKYYVHPPADFRKWADICVHIIRHYNARWAGGFAWNIRYWEIRNEPDLGDPMWSGTDKDYFRLYATAARAIKDHDPNLRVGGPAATYPTYPFIVEFLDTCRSGNVPLDFCSISARGTPTPPTRTRYGTGARTSGSCWTSAGSTRSRAI